MSYPEELRNYKGPWPPSRDFLRQDAPVQPVRRRSASDMLKDKSFLTAIALWALLLDVKIHRGTFPGQVFHVFGLILPVIRGAGYYSHGSLGVASGVMVLIIAALFGGWLSVKKLAKPAVRSLLLQLIHKGQAPRSPWGLLFNTTLAILVSFPVVMLAILLSSDIQGYWALYVQHAPAYDIWSSGDMGFRLGVLTGNGFDTPWDKAGVLMLLFHILRWRYGFPIFALVYSALLRLYVYLMVLVSFSLYRTGAIFRSMREDWRVLAKQTGKLMG